MTVLLPKKKTNALPKVPTAEVWQQLNEQMDSTLVDVSLPRFETDTDIDLKPIMTKLGMPDAFNPFKADFRNFCNTEVYIELMKQVAKIKVDEEGTEAAAVTVIGFVDTSIGPEPQYVTFHANHPFLYVISEQQTGAVLFIGQYTGY
jgi:serpin B